MVCPNCKNEIKDTETSCKKCGAIVSKTGTIDEENEFEGVYVDDYNVHLNAKIEDKTDNVNTKALTSAIISIMSIFLFGFISIIGIILGIIALKEIKNNKQNGKNLAITGIVVGSFSLIAYVVLFIVVR